MGPLDQLPSLIVAALLGGRKKRRGDLREKSRSPPPPPPPLFLFTLRMTGQQRIDEVRAGVGLLSVHSCQIGNNKPFEACVPSPGTTRRDLGAGCVCQGGKSPANITAGFIDAGALRKRPPVNMRAPATREGAGRRHGAPAPCLF